MGAIKAKNVALQQSLEALRGELHAARTELDARAAALAAAQAELDQRSASLDTTTVESLQAELERARAERDARAAEAAEARAERERALAELAAANKALTEENTRLRAAGAGAPEAGDDEGVGEDESATRAHVARLTLANRNLQERVAELEKNEVRRAARAADADADTVEQLSQELAAAEERLGRATSEGAGAVARLAETSGALTSVRAELASLRVKYEQRIKEQGVEGLSADNDALQAHVDGLNGELAAARDALASTERKLDAALAEAEHLREENREVSERLAGLEATTTTHLTSKHKPSESAALQVRLQ